MKEYNVDISRLFAHMTSIMADSVTEKDEDLLYDYVTRLKPIQYQSFVRNVYRLVDRKTKGNKRAKITHNAIKLALRIEQVDSIRVFPFIEKIATKGWDTKGGTYSFSMPILVSTGKDIDEYESKCIEGKAFQVMIDNNLDFDIALYPYELVTYGETGQVFQNWMQYILVKEYLKVLRKIIKI